MSYRIVPRTEIGLPNLVTSANGAPRPPLWNEQYVTYHYTGVTRSYATSDVPQEILRIQRTFSNTKPFEYNYVIGQTEDDNVYEYAGLFMAAHSSGENADSFGILFLNSVNEPLTPRQIRKAQWLVSVLRYTGHLRAQVDQRPHRWMPGAATACPGEFIMSQLSELVKPYVEIPPYNPEANQFSLWPFADKEDVTMGAQGHNVLYLHDVMRLKAGQNVCGDLYNPATERAVRNIQGLFEIHDEHSFCGQRTWGAIDFLALQ